MKPYEALFILAETVRDENVDEFAAKLRGEIERLGGTVEQTLNMGRRPFASPLRKREGGIYLRIDFQMDPAQFPSLQPRLRLNENIFRMQFVNVAKERRLAANAKAKADAKAAAAPQPASQEA